MNWVFPAVAAGLGFFGLAAQAQSEDVNTAATGVQSADYCTSANQVDGDRWLRGPRISSARAQLSAVHAGSGAFETVFALGGQRVSGAVTDLERLDLAQDRWVSATPIPEFIEGFAAAGTPTYVVAAGGYYQGGQTSDQVFLYNVAERIWQRAPRMPRPKADFALAAMGETLFAFAGVGPGGEEAYRLDPGAQNWVRITPAPFGRRRGLDAVTLDGLIYLIGGIGRTGLTSDVAIYDPVTDNWSEGPALPGRRLDPAVAVFDGALYLFGGRDVDQNKTLTDVLTWRPGDEAWSCGTSMSLPRTGHAAAGLDARLYVLGGGAGAGALSAFTAFDATDIYLPPLR